MRLYPVVGEVRIGDYKRDQMRALVAIDHGLSDFRFDGQHTFYTLRGDVVPTRIHNDVFFAVGDADIAVFVDVPNIAGMKPTVPYYLRGRLRVVPVALHDEFAAHEDFTVARDTDFDVFHGRADGAHLVRVGRVAADDRRGFGHPVSLQDRQAEAGEEYADIVIERRAARDEGLQSAAEPLLHLAADKLIQEPVEHPINRPERRWVLISSLANFDGFHKHRLFQAARLFDTSYDPAVHGFRGVGHG